jgi:UV DNA damage endonuclease
VGAPLRPHDSRRWQQAPHLSVSLAYLRDILGYLAAREIHLYRLSSALAPYATHPGLPAFHEQIGQCQNELAAVGDVARAAAIRLTMHPGPWVRLATDDEGLAARARNELAHCAALLDAMGVGSDGVLVVHGGLGARGGSGGALRLAQEAALGRFARQVDRLPPAVRHRLVIENDDRSVGLGACLWLQRRTGLPVVLDLLHHRCHNPEGMPASEALELALESWPAEQRPKVHLSSPRTELRLLRKAGGGVAVAAPLPTQHSDFLNPFEAIDLLQMARGLRPFDILLEAKAHDLALLRLRAQIGHFAPELAPLIG